MPKNALPELHLTESQKEHARRLFKELPEKELTLNNLTKLVSGDDSLTGQSQFGRVLKEFLGSENFNFKTTTNRKLGDRELTDDQKKKLAANVIPYAKGDIGPLELTRIIFEDNTITNLHQEFRTTLNYLKSLIDNMDPGELKQLTSSGKFVEETGEPYKPPKSLVQVLSRINQYVIGAEWKESNLKNEQRKKAEALLKYLNTFSVKQKISSYTKQIYRDTFEDHFIRYTYDKIDLTEEEVDSFLLLCNEKVQEMILNEQITVMWNLLEQQSQDGDGKRISKSLVDAITAARADANQCQIRQNRLLQNLVQKRADKESALKEQNASILNLVLPWREEEFRKRTIHLAIKEQEKLKDEVERLGSLDELTCMIRGIDPRSMYGE